jgi:acetyl-CoA carboxylase biotin carboxylase subunit
MAQYFKKVFVANRGEIACRAIRALRELGIPAVVGYSDCDRLSLAVRMADEAYRLGPSPASLSYLDGGRIVQMARDTGCDALFPGYGFLAENADFADACGAAGITFVGPSGDVIRKMGDKAEARRTLAAAGLPVTPGIEDVDGPEDIRAFAEEVGYPVLIKPVAGGGGKGMFRIDEPGEIVESLATSRSVAAKAFGSDRVYVEKLIIDPCHIEFQFLADKHGNALHLGERECSVQRNHQKLLEEAPSTKLTAEQRAEMGAKVAKAMSDIGYITAGTMEFLYEAPTQNLYVMEVNTRIQVEHTVTEMVIGVDIIRKMIRAAAGYELGLTQEDITFVGHAIQCRINAEDPKQGFAPSFGKITGLRQAVGQFIRNDSGVYNGWEVPSHYDSLLAKICTVGRHRTLAIERMKRALDEFLIEGIKTTVPLHRAIMDHPEFVDCSFNTGFIDKHLDGLLEYEEGEGIYDVTRVAALVAEITALGHNPHCE